MTSMLHSAVDGVTHCRMDESSPLLQKHTNHPSSREQTSNVDVADKDTDTVFPVQILVEIIGARNLPIAILHGKPPAQNDKRKRIVESYCAVQFGTKTLHRTKTILTDANPIWTLKESPMFLVSMTANDLRNHKAMVITVWGRTPKLARSSSSQYGGSNGAAATSTTAATFMGKTRIKSGIILELCCEERIEMDLVDEFDRAMPSTSSSEPNAALAMRFRMASHADQTFIQQWDKARSMSNRTGISRSIVMGTGVWADENRERVTLVTEIDEWKVPGASLATAAYRNKPALRSKKVLVKPFPNAPDQQYMTREEIKTVTNEPSHQWIDIGSGILGRLFLEILSCHKLPNVDYGNAVGNQTDAFVCAIYGDAMAETSIIDDELSPHWPPWSQRAFCFALMHPSHVLYLGVFGYKRGIFNHVPIGRVEINPINFQRDTDYTLQYGLYATYHVQNRKPVGNVRIRLRLEYFDERAVLLAALRPCPPIYINTRKKKSFCVAQFTASGEYDNNDKFSLKILLAYVDEILKGFLRRLIYSINDGGKSLIFWRDQVKVGPIWLPLHSFLAFCTSFYIVENPSFIPAFLCLGSGYLMLLNMHLRNQSPSPWYKTYSYKHYLSILIFGKSSYSFTNVEAEQGWDAQQTINEAMKKRYNDDDRFFVEKELLEKEIERIEKISVQTKSKDAIIPLELLVILGKIQGIVGGFVRSLRAIETILNWEESDLAFWVTSTLFCIGVIFLFIPWAFLLKWTSRIAVVCFLGPQNKVFDVLYSRNENKGSKLQDLFEERLFRARCRQEEASHLKGFRQVLFGKFSSLVPSIRWTPHLDRPLSSSIAVVTEKVQYEHVGSYIPGQQIYGKMIRRPYSEWLKNLKESNEIKQTVLKSWLEVKQRLSEDQPFHAHQNINAMEKEENFVEEEGIEVADEYDLEANLGTFIPITRSIIREESLNGDWGVEAVDLYSDEASFVRQPFLPTVETTTSEDMLSLSSSEESIAVYAEDYNAELRRVQPGINAQVGLPIPTDDIYKNCTSTNATELTNREAAAHVRTLNADQEQSYGDLGVEVVVDEDTSKS